MTVTKVVRYRTGGPQAADENERLIRDVFAELATTKPQGLRYSAFRLDDGVSFLHVAVLDDGAANPLAASSAFGRFQAGIKDRCVEGPAPADATAIGSYRLLPE
jgi:hypothetical protein